MLLTYLSNNHILFILLIMFNKDTNTRRKTTHKDVFVSFNNFSNVGSNGSDITVIFDKLREKLKERENNVRI